MIYENVSSVSSLNDVGFESEMRFLLIEGSISLSIKFFLNLETIFNIIKCHFAVPTAIIICRCLFIKKNYELISYYQMILLFLDEHQFPLPWGLGFLALLLLSTYLIIPWWTPVFKGGMKMINQRRFDKRCKKLA